ncbi:MAG: hypothetical protein IJJ82_06295 [Clostridia bacterium]|nr:hypothetical protein [Clostridia bacterium]
MEEIIYTIFDEPVPIKVDTKRIMEKMKNKMIKLTKKEKDVLKVFNDRKLIKELQERIKFVFEVKISKIGAEYALTTFVDVPLTKNESKKILMNVIKNNLRSKL